MAGAIVDKSRANVQCIARIQSLPLSSWAVPSVCPQEPQPFIARSPIFYLPKVVSSICRCACRLSRPAFASTSFSSEWDWLYHPASACRGPPPRLLAEGPQFSSESSPWRGTPRPQVKVIKAANFYFLDPPVDAIAAPQEFTLVRISEEKDCSLAPTVASPFTVVGHAKQVQLQ